jgi:hypothetical protein
MTMNDLTAPLGHDPKRHQNAIEIPVAKIVAVALGLFFGAFVLWAMIAQDRSGGEPMAVAPTDLRVAKKPPETIVVPQAAAAAEAAPPATTATLPPAAPPKSANTVTITIIDAKTGAKREVQVTSKAATAAERTQPDQNDAETIAQPPKKR